MEVNIKILIELVENSYSSTKYILIISDFKLNEKNVKSQI